MILAHGIGGRLDLPIPLLYFTLAAITVLVVTFRHAVDPLARAAPATTGR